MTNNNDNESYEFRRRVAKDRRIYIPKEYPEIKVGDLLLIKVRKVNNNNNKN